MSDDDDSNDYTPIACGLYSEYEVAIMHRETLRLHWRDASGMDHIERVIPKDLQTRNHCEYLIAKDCADGSTLELRLDRIISKEQESP
jgi:Rho-binding antiterminator